MKLFVVLTALVAFVASGAVPLVPGDNSHYVEGKSRYVWVADGAGNPVLADLHESPDQEVLNKSGADNEYWLYTRDNPTTPQVLTLGNAMSIWASNYLGSRPLKVIVHGFAADGNSEISTMLTSAWLATTNANIIVVDWRQVASSSYVTAVNQVPNIGRAVATFLGWLINSAGGNWQNVHLTGSGLGGQIAGIAARHASGIPRRLTGLDPVAAMFYEHPEAIGHNGNNEAQYVEVIHTQYTRPNSPRIGHVDFYPNGGNNQPGCTTSICSHTRSYHLFAATILYDHLIGVECFDINEAQSNQCSGSMLLHMGNDILSKNANKTGKRAEDPLDGKWLSSPVDISNTTGITDALPAKK